MTLYRPVLCDKYFIEHMLFIPYNFLRNIPRYDIVLHALFSNELLQLKFILRFSICEIHIKIVQNVYYVVMVPFCYSRHCKCHKIREQSFRVS